ncbi:hypothetical protein GOP47_0026817 [Adiantum capillus-veneris]|nr:hypothetical protein GOP47_0026817 [Adiantum capillus-veneris]
MGERVVGGGSPARLVAPFGCFTCYAPFVVEASARSVMEFSTPPFLQPAFQFWFRLWGDLAQWQQEWPRAPSPTSPPRPSRVASRDVMILDSYSESRCAWMMVDCQEAMGAEAQAPERMVVGGASIATIESLRARLLSERAASKEARQHTQKIALKVSELQSRLDAEIEQRKKAEVAMKEVLEVLRAKGVAMDEVMTAVSSISGSSESEEAAQLSSSKDGESENSSGEESSQVHNESHQGSVMEASHLEGARFGLGGEDSSLYKKQITSMDSSRSENSEVGKQGVTEWEKANNYEQGVLTDALEEHPHTLRDQVGEQSNISQPSEISGDSSKHLEGQGVLSAEGKPDIDCADRSSSESQVKVAPSDEETESNRAATSSFLAGPLCAPLPNEASSSHVSNVKNSKGLYLDESAQTPSGLGDKGAHSGERLHPVDEKMVTGLLPRDVAPPVRESALGLGHNHMHPGLFPRAGYSYEWAYTTGDPLQRMHYVPPTEAPFSRGPISTAYGGEYGRYLPAPISDAVLSLVDDKSGKLGSILMALNLAKQQINDEEHTTSYMEDVCEAALQSPFSGRPYPGLYEDVAHQPPYHPWRPEPQNQAPIIHFPMSPTSDYEASAFDRHDGLRRSSSTSACFMPGYDPYLQPKGELHLGNGITLYTD